jgi:hypothetical protein
MEEITPQTIENPKGPSDLIWYFKGLKKEIEYLDRYIVVIFKDEEGKKMGKMEYSICKSKVQGDVKVLSSYNFDPISELLGEFDTNISHIKLISDYITPLI